MAIEIADWPIEHSDFPVRELLVYQAGYVRIPYFQNILSHMGWSEHEFPVQWYWVETTP